MKDTNVPVEEPTIEDFRKARQMLDEAVPVEKWEEELRELDYKILCGKPGEYSDGDATFLRVKLLSKALQAAKEEERKRIADEVKKYAALSPNGETINDILSIINKHQ